MRAAVTTCHKLGCLKQQEFILKVLEAVSLNQGAGRAVLPLKAAGNPSLFLASGVSGNVWYPLASSCVALVSALALMWHSPGCLFAHGHLLVRTLVILDLGLTLLQYDLILINYICNEFISK